MIQNNLDLNCSESTQKNINMGDIQNLYNILPPKKEQLSIVKFLDNKTSAIDKKISILERRNVLLEELEKSMINQCVTKGINSFTQIDKQGNKIDFDNTLGKNQEDFDIYMNECGYKDSGIEWIGYIPKHYEIHRLKDEVNLLPSGIKEFEGNKEYLSTKSIGVNEIKEIEEIITYKKKPSRANIQPVLNGVYGAKMRFTNKSYLFDNQIEVNKYILSTGFFGLISKKYFSSYLNYLIQSNLFIYQKDRNSYGSSQESINENGLFYIEQLKISKKEQLSIVKFLDNKTSAIDKKISILERRNVLLEELEKSMINQCVTKGINSFTQIDKQGNKIDFDNILGKNQEDFDIYMNECGYKDSGIEWIGYIPKHYEINRLKDEILEQKKSNIQVNEAKDNPGDFKFFTSGENEITFKEKIINGKNIYVATGGKANIKYFDGEAAYSTDTYVIQSKVNTKVLYYYLYSIQNIINDLMFKGMGLKHLQKYDFKNNFFIKFSKKEQLSIVKFLDNKTQQFKQQKEIIQKEIDFLNEFKKSLINDAVTGKIKVVKD